MKDYLSETLETYENNLDRYLAGTPQTSTGDFKKFIDEYISTLPKKAYILELGSGTGRDANYIETQIDVVIDRTDVVQAFIDYQKDSFGLDVQHLDARHLSSIQKYDSIFALAVLLHFSKEDCARVCKNIFNALKKGGSFVFRMKNKTGKVNEEISFHKMQRPRYFRYWTSGNFIEMLENIGFSCDTVSVIEGGKWIQGIAWKR